jgi:hypothetical protein
LLLWCWSFFLVAVVSLDTLDHLFIVHFVHIDLKQTRRRLSVMSDNNLVEGLESVSLGEGEQQQANGAQPAANTQAAAPAASAGDAGGSFIVNSYGGYSKKGYAPYNPRKKNQDALIMAEDPKTRSLFLCVMVSFFVS